jgi:hypothetical protein
MRHVCLECLFSAFCFASSMPGIVCPGERQRFAEKRRKARAILVPGGKRAPAGGNICREVNAGLPALVAHD